MSKSHNGKSYKKFFRKGGKAMDKLKGADIVLSAAAALIVAARAIVKFISQINRVKNGS